MTSSTRFMRQWLGRLGLTLVLCSTAVGGSLLAALPSDTPTGVAFAASEAAPAAAPALQAVTTIVVDTSTDPDPGSNTDTCTYMRGALLEPDPDGLCSFRRALREAAGRPQTDRPIDIVFNLGPADPGRDLQVPGTWTIRLTPSNSLPPLKTDTILNKNGQVTIDGATQPQGRTTGPPIIIDMGENSIEVESTGNTIRNIAFKNGGAIFLKEDNNRIDNIWMGLSDDGTQVAFRQPTNPFRMAHGGISISSNGNGVRGSILTGAFAKAVNIDGGDNNTIFGNAIGTRADGTVPVVSPAVDCQPTYSGSGWYGGWGIALSGSNNVVEKNIIAGLQTVRSANDTPPIALELFGAGHIISDNRIGVDSAGSEVGVCGQGIKLSGSDHQVLDNLIVRSRTGFEDGEETAILSSDTSPLFDKITVRRNLVKDGPGLIYRFGPGLPKELRIFSPGRVTNINGSTITGANGIDIEGNVSECPNCLIDLYTDDIDRVDEALTYLGETQADANGDWTFVMTQTLPANTGLHTISTSTQDSVIVNYSAGMSTEASKLFLPMTSVNIVGPAVGEVGMDYTYTVTVDPPQATTPFSYTFDLTDFANPLVTQSNSRIVTVTAKWVAPGTKTIDVTVVNDLGSLTASTSVVISGPAATPTPTTPTPAPTPTTPTPAPTPSPSATPQPSGSDTVYLPLMRK